MNIDREEGQVGRPSPVTKVSTGNSLSSLAPKSQAQKRTFTLLNGRKVEAKHTVISSSEVETKTKVHPLNPRNQHALSKNSVRDILPQIRERGVDTEGIAIEGSDGVYLIVEGSRRRFCCIEVGSDLPLWILPRDISPDDISSLIKAAQSSRRFSYREYGLMYLSYMTEHGIDSSSDLSAELKVGVTSINKRLQAARIPAEMLVIFPDYEGIPNSFYQKLGQIQKVIEKNNIDLNLLKQKVMSESKEISEDLADVESMQKSVMRILEEATHELAEPESAAPAWNTSDIKKFDNPRRYAKVSKSKDGRKAKFEFARLSKAAMDKIEAYINDVLKEEQN
ncbi:ParB family protein [Serratia symbiotica]|uniref:ParB family protein n=1 Tax=Serratia symbiotica TaxID=138074 RepID=UPI00132AC581|nr:ParB family protein [Serratia symbiotica]QTP13318.1 ParB N-terminal domain-containing protein [Serratia symbiotica]